MSNFLPYDPGRLPDKPPPKPGESIRIEVEGLPPFKDDRYSIRNPKHKSYSTFVALRTAATGAMTGRAWYRGPVKIVLTIEARTLEESKTTLDYLSGVMDTLDGSHGQYFTYLPIVYEDDCQVSVSSIEHCFMENEMAKYVVDITFLPFSDSG